MDPSAVSCGAFGIDLKKLRTDTSKETERLCVGNATSNGADDIYVFQYCHMEDFL